MKQIAGLVLAALLIVLEWPRSSCISIGLLNAQSANPYASLMNGLGGGMGLNMYQKNLMNGYGMMMGGASPVGGFNKGLTYGLNRYNPELAGKKNLGARVTNNELRRKYFEEKEAAKRQNQQSAYKDNTDEEEQFSANEFRKQKNEQLKKLSNKRRTKANRLSEEQNLSKSSTSEENKINNAQSKVDDEQELTFKPAQTVRKAPKPAVEQTEQTMVDAKESELKEEKQESISKLNFRAPGRAPFNAGYIQSPLGPIHPPQPANFAPPPVMNFHHDDMMPGFYAPSVVQPSLSYETRYEEDLKQLEKENAEANPQNEIDSKIESVILGLMAPKPKVDANVNLIDEIGRKSAEDIKSNAKASTNSNNNEETKKLQFSTNLLNKDVGQKYGPSGFSSLIVISNTNTNNNLAENSENQYSSDHVVDFLSNYHNYTVSELVSLNVTQMMYDYFQKDRNQINDYLKGSEYTKELKANMPTYSVIDNREAEDNPSNSNDAESIVTLKKQDLKNFERTKDDLTYSYMPYGNGGILVINNANKNRNEKLKRILSGEGVNIVNPSGGIELPLSKEEIEKLLEEAIIVSNENSNSNLLK